MSNRRAQEGYALLGVVAFGLVCMLVLLAGFEHIHQAYLLHHASSATPVGVTGNEHALGRGLALLQSGNPAGSPFECRLVAEDGSASFALRFVQVDAALCGGGAGQCWEVAAAPWQGPLDAGSICPLSFGDVCPGEGL